MIKGIIFDLDGVIVDTAKYHFLAWERLAKELNIEFTHEDNEKLKGVSRMNSLDIILEKGTKILSEEEKIKYATQKNNWYVDYLNELKEDEILDGILDLLKLLKEKNIKVALGSASKNAPFILKKLNLESYFDSVVDGNSVSNAKPDPEVFLEAAKKLNLESNDCLVIEDAAAGVKAAINANMKVIGIGNKAILSEANIVFSNTSYLEEYIKTLV